MLVGSVHWPSSMATFALLPGLVVLLVAASDDHVVDLESVSAGLAPEKGAARTKGIDGIDRQERNIAGKA